MSIRRLMTAGACALAASVISAAAFGADVTGAVTVTGFVTGKCTVQPPSTGNNFSGTIALGALDGTDGHISSALTGSSISGASESFTVVCNSARPNITLSATPMTDGVTPDTGYTSSIDYTARLLLLETVKSSTFGYSTAGLPPPTTGNLLNPLSGSTNNVTVSVDSLNTDSGANSSVLTAGNYTGTVSVTIAP